MASVDWMAVMAFTAALRMPAVSQVASFCCATLFSAPLAAANSLRPQAGRQGMRFRRE